EDGLKNSKATCQAVAKQIGCKPEEELVCSTGIIGVQLPFSKIENALPQIQLARGNDIDHSVAHAIMTTDTRPKYFSVSGEIEGKAISVGGMIKGSGMIGPQMMVAPHATLLAFLTTDAE